MRREHTYNPQRNRLAVVIAVCTCDHIAAYRGSPASATRSLGGRLCYCRYTQLLHVKTIEGAMVAYTSVGVANAHDFLPEWQQS